MTDINNLWIYLAIAVVVVFFAIYLFYRFLSKRKIDKNIASRYQCLFGRNDFEAVVFARWPELSSWKAAVAETGADIAGMSGSGSALYGLFRDGARAAKSVASLREKGTVAYGPFLF